MVTLKTLKDATAQQIFDQAAVHLLTQKKKSVNSAGQCKYRHGKLKCAAGCFIADDEYKPLMEGNMWSMLANSTSYCLSLDHSSLISQLQDIHDQRDVENWKNSLIFLALHHGLKTLAIDNL